MSAQLSNNEGWSQLKHGGLLIAPGKLDEFFTELSRISNWQAEQLRRALTVFDGSNEQLSSLLDFVLQDLAGLPANEWQKAQHVDACWSIRSFTGTQIKPRRIWQGPSGETLAVFTPDEKAARQYKGRLGVGTSRQLLGRVVEWLRRTGQSLAVVTNGRQWRLVYAGADHDAWCEWDTDLWFAEGQPSAQVLIWKTLLGRDSLVQQDKEPSTLLSAISASRKGQAELSSVLGERVRQAVEELISASHPAIIEARDAGQVHDHKDLYVAASRLVMRTIITLFAEARGLLPVDNGIYQQAYSLEGLRQQLDRRAAGRASERLGQGRSAWPRMIGLFNLIYQGSAHEALPVRRYAGALFEPGQAESTNAISRALALLESGDNSINDYQVHKLLRLLTRTRMKVRQGRSNRWVDGPVDFSTLSSEYIGILYEGLLDFELKQAVDEPVIFLGLGNQPALGLTQLESMDDAALKKLFEEIKKKDSKNDGADDSDDDETVTEEADAELEADEEDAAEADGEDTDPDGEDNESELNEQLLERANLWLERAAVLAGLVKKPRGKQASLLDDAHQQAVSRAVKQLCARLVQPGEFYLVRWGGTRKGSGTFYTRPQLAAPTVRRTLQPLAYTPVTTAIDPRTGLEEVSEWQPKAPEEILALKVCDPAMGSGSFLAGALRYLTNALTESLFFHGLIERSEDGGIRRIADGKLAELLSDELAKLNPKHERFEEQLHAQLKRHIVENCLYGVDLDPLAVELGRMALWVETMDRDLPFGFLDHKLKVGNSLVGSWFDTYSHYPAMAWEREGGDKDYHRNKPDNLLNHFYIDAKGRKKGDVFTDAIKERRKFVPEQLINQLSGQLELGKSDLAGNVHEELLKIFRKLHRLPVHESEKRARLYQEQVLNNPDYHALKARMDLWCALWFWPGEHIGLAPLPIDFANPSAETLAIAEQVARQQRFFHWELEFPDVFTAQKQGFDALIGNPPWEIQKPNSKEFFSNHDPLYRAYGKQEALTKQLEYFAETPELEHAWLAYNAGFKGMSNWAKYVGYAFGDRITEDSKGKKKYDLNLGGRGRSSFETSQKLHSKWQKQRAQSKSFADRAHPFLHQGSADLNTYKMFLELSHALLDRQGRMGMIVPSGIYTDKGTTELRELFLTQCDWQWLFGFENRDKVFDIDSRFKFCPLIVQKGGPTNAIRAAFMHRNVDDWEQAERYVLAYPRERVEEFSPYSKAILEIRSEQDLRVLQKIYANGVLLGDQSENGWGIKYAREFDMTNDSKLFPPRPKWEEKGYRPDEYGHWLKGPWRDYAGPQHILEREPGLVLSRDGQQALRVDEIEDVALPLYEGRMIGQFDFSEKGWVSGKGRSAVWRDIPFEEKVIEPQYMAALDDVAGSPKCNMNPKIAYMRIGSATNSRTAISSFLDIYPAGDSVFFYRPHKRSYLTSVAVSTNLNSLAYDYHLRNRVGGLNLSEFIMDETSVVSPSSIRANNKLIAHITSLLFCSPSQAMALCALVAEEPQLDATIKRKSWRKGWATSNSERLRVRAILDAIYGHLYNLSVREMSFLLRGCDVPVGGHGDSKYSGIIDPKGFWRIDKDKDPELRHTVLSLIAFHDLQQKGLDAFLAQNDGEGWMLPEQLRLADYGLGHDDRAQEYQPVASRLGPRFYDWQLNEDVERSWQECAAHAELIRQIVPLPEPEEEIAEESATDTKKQPAQGDFF